MILGYSSHNQTTPVYYLKIIIGNYQCGVKILAKKYPYEKLKKISMYRRELF